MIFKIIISLVGFEYLHQNCFGTKKEKFSQHFSHILELGTFQILCNNKGKGFDAFPFSKRKKERKKMSN
jgi:hypothetical protein